MKTRALVLGGSGFLGSFVADVLTEKGYEVRIFDRTSSSYLKSSQEMVVGDLRDHAQVLKATEGCSVVYNFASLADIEESRSHPRETIEINILGNLNALEACKAHGVSRYILASTVYVYSEAGSFYRASKQSAERYVEVFHKETGLPYTILRYGSLYGPRAPEWNGIRKLLEGALKNKKLSYVGNERAMREYIHVEDAARLSVEVLKEEYKNENIMITGHERLSVRSFLDMIAEMLPEEISVEFRNEEGENHYIMTPYSFVPKPAKKLSSNLHIDLGQGILGCLTHLKEEQKENR